MPRKSVTQEQGTEESSSDYNRPSLAQKLLNILHGMQGVDKSSKLPGNMGGSQYHTFEDITNQLRGLLKEQGVMMLTDSHIYNVNHDNGVFCVNCHHTFINTSDPEDTYIVHSCGYGVAQKGQSGMMDGTAMKKAITSATRYMLKTVFLVTDHVDDEETEETQAELHKKPATKQLQPEQQQQAKPNKVDASATVHPTKTESKTNGTTKEARPLTPTSLHASFTKKKLSDARPASEEMIEQVKNSINALCPTQEDRDILKKFFGVSKKPDFTSGVCIWLSSWIAPVYGDDGSVTVNQFTRDEFKAIKEDVEEFNV